ncbi:MAG: chloride channel protein [Bacteroidales bacterium]|nr:chloride channel protein [Bacteroidales bacterium]
MNFSFIQETKITFWLTKSIKKLFNYLNKLRQDRLILLLSFFIGILSAIAAIAMKNCFYYVNQIIMKSSDSATGSLLLLIYPIIGIFITVIFIKKFIKDDISHGISRVLFSIAKKGSKLKSHNTYSSIIASTLTIAFGGSVGAEAPIVLTGASLGSNLGKFINLNYKTLTLLIGCGAAGAISGIFKAPIAGLIFTLEVLMLDLTMASIIPLLISSVTATIITSFFMGQSILLSYTITEPFVLKNIFYYILLGAFAGFISLYFTRTTMFIEGKFYKIINPYKKIFIGGTMLSLLIFIFPPLYGEGYETLKTILSGQYDNFVINSFFYNIRDDFWMILLYLAVILFFKVIAMALTTGSGGIGGIFAPSLFTGGLTGFIFAYGINALPFANLSLHNFALAGMAGVMSGVMHAPLTAIFLIAEITGGYGLFIPLITTSAISFLTVSYFEPHSIYTKRLAKRGELITHDKNKTITALLSLDSLIETDYTTIEPQADLGKLVEIISKSIRNIFPVVDDNKHFYGDIYIDDVRNIIFKPELYNKIFVKDIMIIPKITVSPNESMEEIVNKLEGIDIYNIPVVKNGIYLGYISKSGVFSKYRELLKEISED